MVLNLAWKLREPEFREQRKQDPFADVINKTMFAMTRAVYLQNLELAPKPCHEYQRSNKNQFFLAHCCWLLAFLNTMLRNYWEFAYSILGKHNIIPVFICRVFAQPCAKLQQHMFLGLTQGGVNVNAIWFASLADPCVN